MKKVPSKGQTTSGIDISHHNGYVDFRTLKLAGIEYVFAKCNEYTVDNMYTRHRAGAMSAGLLFGAYDFFHPANDPTVQAHNFLNRSRLDPGDLPAVLDWETTDDIPAPADVKRAQVWLDIVEKATGKKPIIYGSPYFLQNLNLNSGFLNYPLWVAHYGTAAPLVPAPWHDWAFWQFTESGSHAVPHKDLDIFNGTYADLQKMVL